MASLVFQYLLLAVTDWEEGLYQPHALDFPIQINQGPVYFKAWQGNKFLAQIIRLDSNLQTSVYSLYLITR